MRGIGPVGWAILILAAVIIGNKVSHGGMAALKPANPFTADYWNGPKSQPENRW